MKPLQLLFLFSCLLFGSQLVTAESSTLDGYDGIEPITHSDYASASLTLEKAKEAKNDKKGLGKLVSWVKKKAVKLVQKVADIGGIGHPTDKWFWYWIIGWGAGILLTALVPAIAFSGGLSGASLGWLFLLLGSLAWVFGTVSLVVWLVKKFA
jgi:hypothetical protein